MKTFRTLVVVTLIATAGCGSDDEPPATTATTTGQQGGEVATTEKPAEAAPPEDGKGTTVTIGDSDFGEMLFDSNKQAIYIFENDKKGETVCYDECAEAWPPVFTEGDPVAGDGVDASLLGTIKRRDGKVQVTYADQPLYYYAHEDPGVVLCHNVNLNGGLWWVIGPDGKRRP